MMLGISFVIPGRREAASPESITAGAGVMDSGLLAALGPGMTKLFLAALLLLCC